MLTLRLSILLAAGMVCGTTLASSPTAEQPHGFYERKAEGWFWYNEVIPEEEPEPEPEPVAPAVAATPAPKESEPPAPAKGPAVLSAAWVRENLPKYLDAAWDNPTVENVRTYMYLQRYAMDKSEQFADTTELAVVGDPFLDEETRRSTATFASQRIDSIAGMNKDSLVRKIGDKVGMFFFFSSDCDNCSIQAPIIEMLERVDNFTVMPISVDGKPMQYTDLYQNFKVDQGQAELLGITTLPAMFLVSENREIEPLAQGTLSLSELKHRITVVSKRRGWISEEEFNKSRPILNLDTSLAAVLDDSTLNINELKSHVTDPESNFIPPEKLGEMIRNKIRAR